MSGRVEGLSDALAAFDRLGNAGKKELTGALQRSVQKVRSDAIRSIQRGTKSGRVYRRGKGKNLSSTHQASAPGEAPATDTGRLVSSVKATVQGKQGTVFSILDYAFWLEFGTFKMEPRPWLNPALMENEQYIIDAFTRGIEKAVLEFNK